ncbi:MAG TPA: hypothetical protein PLN41_04105 [Methanothrix sp.]|jgi:hypothetical protein|nr:hypothetical protein [Methanothrix sp.]HNT71855.1 hypothetical protein [Methanothrix sp.]HOI68913.1 hypothetical protein [Methanothrix sp.]
MRSKRLYPRRRKVGRGLCSERSLRRSVADLVRIGTAGSRNIGRAVEASLAEPRHEGGGIDREKARGGDPPGDALIF